MWVVKSLLLSFLAAILFGEGRGKVTVSDKLAFYFFSSGISFAVPVVTFYSSNIKLLNGFSFLHFKILS